MKCELFGLSEINIKEAGVFISVFAKSGYNAEQSLDFLQCIDNLLLHEKSKMLITQKRIDRQRSKLMYDKIIEHHLNWIIE